MYFFFPRVVLTLLGLAVCAGTVQAQTPPTLSRAVDAAWALSPQARALQNRRLELDARSGAASSFISGPPSVTLAHRTDRTGSNGGFREYEAEIAAPLWRPGVRHATALQVDADRESLERQQAFARSTIGGEVRELAAQAALASIEQQLAARRLAEASALSVDIQRRVKVGDAARIDLLQALALVQLSAGNQAQARSALQRAQLQWQALTGIADVSKLDEPLAKALAHPAVDVADAQLRAAQARLALVEKDRSDPVEVGIGFARERASLGANTESRMRVAVRIPFGGDNRNLSRIAAARAEVDVAEADTLATARRVEAGRSAAAGELEAARRSETMSAERARLSTEAQALIAKSYQLGESDLPTRLRADNERFDAELSYEKARVETRRAIARLNQANGAQP